MLFMWGFLVYHFFFLKHTALLNNDETYEIYYVLWIMMNITQTIMMRFSDFIIENDKALRYYKGHKWTSRKKRIYPFLYNIWF